MEIERSFRELKYTIGLTNFHAKEVEYILQEIKYHVTFVSQTEQFDTSSAIGSAMLRIIMVFAQLESEMTAERIHAVLTFKASEGEWTGGQPPYGYQYDIETKEITVNEMESQVVKYIFHCYEILRSCRTIADLLNRQHFKTTMGNNWNAKAIEDILKNPFYNWYAFL